MKVLRVGTHGGATHMGGGGGGPRPPKNLKNYFIVFILFTF